MTKTRRISLLVVLIVAALGGGVWLGYRWMQPKVIIENDTYALVDGYQSSGSDARMEGHLALVVGGCLGIKQADGREKLVIWPHGTKVEAEAKIAVVVGGKKVGMGESVALGGAPARDRLAPKDFFYNKIPKGCRSISIWNGTSIVK